jgi:hypothetical protein
MSWHIAKKSVGSPRQLHVAFGVELTDGVCRPELYATFRRTGQVVLSAILGDLTTPPLKCL